MGKGRKIFLEKSFSLPSPNPIPPFPKTFVFIESLFEGVRIIWAFKRDWRAGARGLGPSVPFSPIFSSGATVNDLIIKICGMREQADLDCAAALGVNLCGFIFAPQSPRAVTPEQAAALDSGDMLRVGVFVTDDMRFIEETARAARLDRVQLHGDQSMTCANRLSRTLGAERLIRVLWPERYPDLAALEETMNRHAATAGMFLLDAGRSKFMP